MKKIIENIDSILTRLSNVKYLGLTFNRTDEQEYTIHVMDNPLSMIPDSIELLTFILTIKDSENFEVKFPDMQKSRMFKNYISHMISIINVSSSEADLYYEIVKHFPNLFDNAHNKFKIKMAMIYEDIMAEKLNSISSAFLSQESVIEGKKIIKDYAEQIKRS